MSKATKLGERLAAITVGGFRYNSPWTQVALVGVVCFCSVGMFSALAGLGAGGTQDITMANISNSILYGVFAISGFIAGPITNILGPRLTLCIGVSGYSLYTGSLWAFQVHDTKEFVYVAGGFLGFTAALLWSAQGSIMMSYPQEKDKGRAFSLFWSIFAMGGVVGAAIALGIEAQRQMPQVSTAVYLVFLIIMLTALVTSWLILPPNYVVRGDGTLVELQDSVSPATELRAWLKFFRDWRLLLLLPMFFASNYFYAYQNSIVAFQFNSRTRALASLVTNLGAVLGANLIGMLLDHCPGKRRTRTIVGWSVVLFLQCLVWSGGIGWQVQFNRKQEPLDMDWSHPKSPGVLWLMMSYYLADAAYQGLAYYIMASLTNDPFVLARMTGYYKGLQSAGAAVSYGMDAVKTPYLTGLIVSWGMILFSLPLALIVILKTKDTNYDENTVHVEQLGEDALHHAALPKGHHAHDEHAHSDAGFGDRDSKDLSKKESV